MLKTKLFLRGERARRQTSFRAITQAQRPLAGGGGGGKREGRGEEEVFLAKKQGGVSGWKPLGGKVRGRELQAKLTQQDSGGGSPGGPDTTWDGGG